LKLIGFIGINKAENKSILFKYLDSLDVGANISKDHLNITCLDGLDFVEVDEFNYQYKKEGEYYKE
jgi:hypothetical protein